MPSGKVIYGHYCPLCGKPAVVDGKCQACLYVIGSDPDIDGSPVQHGGYPDELLVQMKAQRNANIWSVMPGTGLLLIVVGLLVYANGGPWWIFGIGLGVLVVCLVRYSSRWGREERAARANWRRYWAEGGPDRYRRR